MNVLKAMDMTLALARRFGLDKIEAPEHCARYEHLVNMFREIERDDTQQPDKYLRHLGYIQGVVVARTMCSIHYINEINSVCAIAPILSEPVSHSDIPVNIIVGGTPDFD